MAIELAEDGQDPRIADRNVMVRIGGKSFRCACGCNVFGKLWERTVDDEELYECNSCQTMFSAA